MGIGRGVVGGLLGAAALAGVAFAATEAETAALARSTMSAIQQTSGDTEDVMAAISSVTQGAQLDVITAALCQLQQRRNLHDIFARETGELVQAQTTLDRPEVGEALGEACEVARLALASYGATGGVPAGGAPGQAFGATVVGAPGGGGGSGYVTN